MREVGDTSTKLRDEGRIGEVMGMWGMDDYAFDIKMGSEYS
ncbi:unnamed protein product [uncultured virus]|nr:unnamed protein product [uncultured virus]